MERGHEDSICALDIHEMLANGVPDQEILLAWLTDLHFEDYYDLFASAGYDMPTISKMTPEDLTAIGEEMEIFIKFFTFFDEKRIMS